MTTSAQEAAEVLNNQYCKQFTKEDTTNLPNTPANWRAQEIQDDWRSSERIEESQIQ